MISASFLAGEWTDIVPHPQGYAQVTLEQPGIATAYVNGVQVWRRPTGWGLYLHETLIDGQVVAAQQRHVDGQCVAFHATEIKEFGPAFGQNCVAWIGNKLFIQRSATISAELTLNGQLEIVEERLFTHAPTSQGFHDPAGGIFWADDAREATPGMAFGFTRGGLAIGQSQTARQLRLAYNGQFSIAYDGDAFEPRLVQLAADTWVGCARTPRGALTLSLTPPFAPEVVAPPPPPPVVPPSEPPHVAIKDVPNYTDELKAIAAANPVAFRNAHGDYDRQGQPGFLTEEQANEFIRIAAYELNKIDGRIGLNGKRATNTLSQDVLCFRHDDGMESVIDCINGAGGSNPSIGWNVVGHYRRAGDGQKWIQPRAVNSNPTPNPGPTPKPPTPPVMPAPSEFPSFIAPWDIFLEGFYRFRDNIHDRDKVGDSVGAGALAYFIPHYQNGTNDYVKRFGLPVHTTPQDFADQWRRLVNEGVTRAIAAYQRDQGRP